MSLPQPQPELLGPQAQRASLERWCAGQGAELVAVHTDHGVSGGTEIEERPGLLAALDTLRPHDAGVLLVAKRDRLARDPIVAAMVERLAERNGVRVCTADGTANGREPHDVLMRRIIGAFAEYERLIIKARTRAALAVKRDRGERVSREPAYGYRLAPDGSVKPYAEEQRAVKLAKRYRAEGLTLNEIGVRLAGQGLLPRSGGRWHPQTIARIAE